VEASRIKGSKEPQVEAIGGYVATGRRQYGFDGIISHPVRL
jgi:hypothetical protein